MNAHRFHDRVRTLDPVSRTGRIVRVSQTHLEADGPNVPIGTLCRIETRDDDTIQLATIVAIAADAVVLMPLAAGAAVVAGARVIACGFDDRVVAGSALLGRAIDALGRPVDGGAAPRADQSWPIRGVTVSPLERASPTTVFETGIRAIDGLLTLGRGQRIGIFAASGGGKTTLLGQIARQATADVIILCLIGERGREAEALWNRELDATSRARATMVVATSDQSAAMRVRAGDHALALAEYWRGEGKHVLLLLDSATRLAMAMREIGLAAGEPPTVRAYPPSVFAAIPRIVERCGALRAGGAITACLTVLAEGDDIDDPISELMKSLLDGHLLLSRTLAERGHHPAIDVPRSISRQADGVLGTADRARASRILEWLSLHEAARTLIDTGLYVRGHNPETDLAIERRPAINAFLRQARDVRVPIDVTRRDLELLIGAGT